MTHLYGETRGNKRNNDFKSYNPSYNVDWGDFAAVQLSSPEEAIVS